MIERANREYEDGRTDQDERLLRAPWRAVLTSGIIAGLVGGVAMGILAGWLASEQGTDFWAPAKLVASLFWGSDVASAGAGAAILGTILHLVVAAGLGAIFAVATRDWDSGPMVWLTGPAYGFTVMMVMQYVVLPLANRLLRDVAWANLGWWFILHLVYSGALLVTPLLQWGITRAGRTEEPLLEQAA